MKQWRMYCGVAVLGVILLVAIQRAASWRPHRIVFVGSLPTDIIGGPQSQLAAQGRMLVVQCMAAPGAGTGNAFLVWDTSTWQLKRRIPIQNKITEYEYTAAATVSSDAQNLVVLRSEMQRDHGASPPENLAVTSSLGDSHERPLAPVASQPSLSPLWKAYFSLDGRQVAASSPDGIVIWSTATGTVVRSIIISASGWRRENFLSPDFKTVVHTDSGGIELWDIQGAPKRITPRISGENLHFAPDSQCVLYYHYAHSRRLLVCADIATGRTKWTVLLSDYCRDATWSRDGKTVFALASKQIIALDAGSGTPVGSIYSINTMQIFPAPESNAVWCLDNHAQLWSQRVY